MENEQIPCLDEKEAMRILVAILYEQYERKHMAGSFDRYAPKPVGWLMDTGKTDGLSNL